MPEGQGRDDFLPMKELDREVLELKQRCGMLSCAMPPLSLFSSIRVKQTDPNPFPLVSPLQVRGSPSKPDQASPVRDKVNPFPTFVQPMETVKPIFKPRDIPKLELEKLQGLNASARVQMFFFFESVEQCSPSDEGRIQIAKMRVSSELSIMIPNLQRKKGGFGWDDLTRYLGTEFRFEVSIDRAWQALKSKRYDRAEPAQAFVQ